ncbi:MAG: hypothetical protein IH621_15990 [Krumholzibacteria bacterium]|nr:hypothetical protein [Candidatus Krumholzibacteria bacterium]
MPRPFRIPRAAARLLGAAALLSGVAGADLAGSKAHAQIAMGEPADVRFELVNATTGQPGSADRLTVEYISERHDIVLDIAPEGSSVLAAAVPLKDIGNYVVTLWKEGVPYHFSRKGHDLATAVQTLHVFDTTTDRTGVRISGLTAVLRRQESLLHVELMLQVLNDTRPQATVVGSPGSFGLDLPTELTDVAAEYHRALDPTPVRAVRTDGRLELGVPLVSGLNRIRLSGVLPWREGVEVGIGSDRPIDAWSLLVAPDWTEVAALELEPDPDGAPTGHKRFKGPALEAGRTLTVRLGAGGAQPGPAEDLFAEPAPEAAAEAPAANGKGGSLPLPLLVVVGVILLVLVLRRRRG